MSTATIRVSLSAKRALQAQARAKKQTLRQALDELLKKSRTQELWHRAAQDQGTADSDEKSVLREVDHAATELLRKLP